jgi:hypothetical protein
MSEQKKTETGEVLIDTMLSKLERQEEKLLAQERKIEVVERRINEAPDLSTNIRELRSGLQSVLKSAQSQKFPEDKIKELSSQLDRAIAKLGEPLKHHHYVPKIMWITVSLFLLLCMATIGWGVTSASLKVYMANDVKYRKLELTQDSASLVYLWHLDSIYTANPNSLQNYVTEQERLKRQREELLDHVHILEKRIDTSEGKLNPPKDN